MRRTPTSSLLFALSVTGLAAGLATGLLAGCLGSDDAKPAEEELLDDSKADSQRKPTYHGGLAFAAPEFAELTQAERYHAWTFELLGQATVDLTTSYALLGQRRTDTVLYLYKESATGWGPYIARNDDYGSTTYSQLVRSLDAGRYRVLVKGHQATTTGKFKVTVGCEGPGCPDPDACLFGGTYNDISTSPALEVLGRLKIYPATLGQLTAADQQRLMLAVMESSHTDVTTPAEALTRVDQEEMNVVYMVEPAAQRAFVAFEYGAGDNSYGAIFDRELPATAAGMVTSIHDGDLYECTVQRETCLLSDDWLAMRSDPAFTSTAARVVTAAGSLSALEATQAVIAFRQSYDDVTTAADGLSRVDGKQLTIQSFRHTTGKEVTVVEYGAGDTSVGAIFYQGTATVAGLINDLAIEGCTLFAE
ncbi:MAG: hypothetical protein H0X17_07145 [Deltaproteobacteria bacterium]|nr:hypothetical protein [Deltaproteobacteria bacterium]